MDEEALKDHGYVHRKQERALNLISAPEQAIFNFSTDGLKFRLPFRLIVVGSSNSGKSRLIHDLLKNRERVFDTELDRVTWCVKADREAMHQSFFRRVRKTLPGLHTCAGLPSWSDPFMISEPNITKVP